MLMLPGDVLEYPQGEPTTQRLSPDAMRWTVHPADKKAKSIEVEADKLVELRTGRMALVLDAGTLVCCIPVDALCVRKDQVR